jgi:hypothetical protein
VPNTLAHAGLPTLVLRWVVRGADWRWAYLACTLPDIPWVLQRAVRLLPTGIDRYDLCLFSTVQASLAFCLVLAAGLALLSARGWRTFTILGLGSLLHLLLDATEAEWASGVHLLAPFDWRPVGLGLLWPEDAPTVGLTLLGLVLLVASWRRASGPPRDLRLPGPRRALALALLALVYLVGPLPLLGGPESTDSHFVRTLRARAERPGRYVELDHAAYRPGPAGGGLRTFAGEVLAVEGFELDRAARVSIRGRFVSADRVRVLQHHVHAPFARDAGSYVGLAAIAALWLHLRGRGASDPRARRPQV